MKIQNFIWSGTNSNKVIHHALKTLTLDIKVSYHGHVDIVWIAGIVIRSASCLSCLGIACV